MDCDRRLPRSCWRVCVTRLASVPPLLAQTQRDAGSLGTAPGRRRVVPEDD